jgi:hypothetical protein
LTLASDCYTILSDLSKEEHMFRKYRVIKSVDNEGRRVITYIKNNLEMHNDGRLHPKSVKQGEERLPEALQVTVRMP